MLRSLTLALSLAAAPAFAAGIEISVQGAHTAGVIKIDLLEDVAPNHVAQITALAADGFYDGVYFHRVIDGFMAQTGDGQFGKITQNSLRRAGTGGSDLGNIDAEFSDIPFDRGVVGMARSQSPNSANSQFFIMFAQGYNLNNQYTVVGRVTEGLDVLDNIKRGDGSTLRVTGEPDHMVSVTVTD
ncbi:MAG: peptidylprolyl isomerase [Pseudomonadota bacterium]